MSIGTEKFEPPLANTEMFATFYTTGDDTGEVRMRETVKLGEALRAAGLRVRYIYDDEEIRTREMGYAASTEQIVEIFRQGVPDGHTVFLLMARPGIDAVTRQPGTIVRFAVAELSETTGSVRLSDL